MGRNDFYEGFWEEDDIGATAFSCPPNKINFRSPVGLYTGGTQYIDCSNAFGSIYCQGIPIARLLEAGLRLFSILALLLIRSYINRHHAKV